MAETKTTTKASLPLAAKAVVALALMLAVAAGASAQNKPKHALMLGVDRDTLLYLIASPFDNWWVNVSGGVQTFFGNEQDFDARVNTLNLGARVEVGKWILPDLALSLRVGAFHVNSQGCYAGRNPWLDKDATPWTSDKGYTYYPQSIHGLLAMGVVTFDWTNFLNGYESGKRHRWHFYTPVGMGGMWLYGKQINPQPNDPFFADHDGKLRWNRELAFSGGFMTEYYAFPNVSFNAAAELLGTRGTIDWTYTQDDPNAPHRHRIVDWVPSIYLGVKISMVHHRYKRNLYTGEIYLDTVYHEFQTVGSRNQLLRIENKVKELADKVDDLQNLADQLVGDTAKLMAQVDEANREIDSLQRILDSTPRPAENIFQDIARMNEELGLPATVVYYQLDKFDLDVNAHKRLRNFAKQMAKLSDTLDFVVIGAADSLTGSKRHNDWLSERRCEAARNSLVKDYGANAAQLTLVPMGGITAYEPKEDNRMAMIILRTPEIEAIIEKWTRYRK